MVSHPAPSDETASIHETSLAGEASSTVDKEVDGKKVPSRGNRCVRFLRGALAWSLWAYLIFLVVLMPVFRVGGDHYWWATLFLYAPRVLYGFPFLIFVLAMFLLGWRRHQLVLLLIAFFLWFFPIAGFNIPWRTAFAWDASDSIKILTCNVFGITGDRDMLSDLIRESDVDLVGLQEHDEEHPPVDWPKGWYHRHYNELAVGSRWPILRTEIHKRKFPPDTFPLENAMYCVIDSPAGPIGFATVHLSSPREPILGVFDRRTVIDPSKIGPLKHSIRLRRSESAEVIRWLEQFPEPKIIVGDLNLVDDSSIFLDTWARYADAFHYAGFGLGITKKTRIPCFGSTFGTRIDYILLGPRFRPVSCRIGPTVISDHYPVIGEVDVVEEE